MRCTAAIAAIVGPFRSQMADAIDDCANETNPLGASNYFELVGALLDAINCSTIIRQSSETCPNSAPLLNPLMSSCVGSFSTLISTGPCLFFSNNFFLFLFPYFVSHLSLHMLQENKLVGFVRG